VVTHPVLYFPAGLTIPREFADLHESCGVQLRSLPQAIERMGDVKPEDLPSPGLLYLPNPYVVPGGRFNEMYGWDSYFIVLGLLRSGRRELAIGIVENFLFEIEHYGAVLNANRTYYLTRSQPPFLTSMIRSVYQDGQNFANPSTANTWLDKAYRAATKCYEMWREPHRRAGNTGLTRYYDVDCGPVPELADDSHYFHDVIEWLLAHPEEDPGYLVKTDTKNDQNGAPMLRVSGCNPRTGVAHEPAEVGGYRLTDDFYRGDRAMRESGYDSSFRFGPFCGSTHDYAPVCLNSLLYRYERDMAHFAELLNRAADVQAWNLRADQRANAIHRYLWKEDIGLFLDYDFRLERISSYNYLSAYYPLWAGVATASQADALRKNLHRFEREGGLAMSCTDSGMQWDEPYGWAPANWIVAEGLSSYGFHDDARRVSKSFLATIDENFEKDATVREKYDVVEKDIKIRVMAGYKQNNIGFGWTNGVYLMMREMLAREPQSS
jgi:alpha,alpha-trehalase